VWQFVGFSTYMSTAWTHLGSRPMLILVTINFYKSFNHFECQVPLPERWMVIATNIAYVIGIVKYLSRIKYLREKTKLSFPEVSDSFGR
jgi:hypothetical protein